MCSVTVTAVILSCLSSLMISYSVVKPMQLTPVY